MEEQWRWCLERAERCLHKGEFDAALHLLRRVERTCPHAPGLPEILAIAHVFHHGSSSPNARTTCPHRNHLTNWVNENSDVNTIKKRYRQLALLLHPDKNKHELAEEAFKLVSKAYGLLSDETKRANFDLDLMQRQCKKCSSTSHIHSENQYKMGSHLHSKTPYKTSSYQEPLKQRSAHVHGFHFSSDSHLAEWRLEHERLRMFRQRAQEKIDSLAQILGRSRWSEEMDKIKGRRRGERYERLTADSVRRCMEKGDHETEQLHPFTKSRGRFEESDRQSCFPSESHQRALLARGARRLGARRLPLSEKIQSLKSGEAQNLELLQRLDGLVGILKEEIGSGSGGSSNHTRARDSKLFRRVEESKMTGRVNENDNGFVYCDFKTNNDACLCAQLDDDAYGVIDDFLSRLSSSPDSYWIAADASDLNFGNDCRTSCQGSARNDFTEMPYTRAARNCREFQVLRKPSLHNRTRISAHDIGLEAVRRPSSHHRDSVTTTFSYDQRSNVSDVGSKDNVFENMESSKACHSKEQRNTIQNQSKRSEQLLRTLERLREETQLVAAALESMKEHVTREFHKISGISTSGNCIIAA